MNMRELAWSWESRLLLLHDPCAFYKNNIEESTIFVVVVFFFV